MSAPACTRLGQHCQELRLTLYIADTTDSTETQNDLGTWLLGHTQRISFGKPYRAGGEVLVEAVVRVPCKYLEKNVQGARCKVHGHIGSLPRSVRPGEDATRRHPDGRHTVFHDGRMRTLDLEPKRRRVLPTLSANPCVGAPCRTADNTRGAACCRDLTLDIILPAHKTHDEDLLRSRKSPYLCKVERVDDRSMECEVISACDYLSPDDKVTCVLHDRKRPDGSNAKPGVCYEWPDLDRKGFTGHPGCVFLTDPS